MTTYKDLIKLPKYPNLNIKLNYRYNDMAYPDSREVSRIIEIFDDTLNTDKRLSINFSNPFTLYIIQALITHGIISQENVNVTGVGEDYDKHYENFNFIGLISRINSQEVFIKELSNDCHLPIT